MGIQPVAYPYPAAGLVRAFPRESGAVLARPLSKVKAIDPTIIADAVLAERVQSGDREHLKELIARHSPRLLLLIRSMVPPGTVSDSPEDILQDTWVLMMRKIHLFDPGRPFKPWITQIAVNCCRDRLRRERFRRIWFRQPRTCEEAFKEIEPRYQEPVDERIEIEKGLARLSAKLREVVVMKFYAGLTIEETAQVLKIPSGTVKSRLNYALETLRQALAAREVSGHE